MNPTSAAEVGAFLLGPRAFLILVIGIMLLMGGFGGLVNYLQNRKSDPESDALGSVAGGIAAAFLVPLFLQMISSNLFEKSQKDHIQLFVFAGFCLIAAIVSKSFLQTVAQRVLQLVNETKREVGEVKKEVKGVAAEAREVKETLSEPEAVEITPGTGELRLEPRRIDIHVEDKMNLEDKISTKIEEDLDLDSESRKIVDALDTGRFKFRTGTGLMSDTQLDAKRLVERLRALIDRGFVRTDESGRHYLTSRGAKALFWARVQESKTEKRP